MWAERLGLWLMGLPAILAVRQDSTYRHIFRDFLSRILKPDPDLDPGGQKLATNKTKIREFSCFEVLDVLF
jgi:hypothetical protein